MCSVENQIYISLTVLMFRPLEDIRIESQKYVMVTRVFQNHTAPTSGTKSGTLSGTTSGTTSGIKVSRLNHLMVP